MGDGAVVLAIIERARKDADGRLSVSIGLADGEATALRFTEAAARVLIAELRDALNSPTEAAQPQILRGIPQVTGRMQQAGADLSDRFAWMLAPPLLAEGADPIHEPARQAASEIPGAQFVSLPGLKHVAPYFRTDLVFPHVQPFLAKALLPPA